MAQKSERITIVTPPGLLEWPKFNKVNFGSEQYPVKGGNFETKIIIDTKHPEYAAFIAKLEPIYEKAKEIAMGKYGELPVATRKDLKGKNPPDGIRLAPLTKAMYDDATEELLDTVKAKFAMKAGGTTKAGKLWSARPVAFSASGKPLPLFINAPGTPHHGKPHPKAREIYSGTLARVSFEVELNEYLAYLNNDSGSYGIRANLKDVQILKYGDAPVRGFGSSGFTAEEGYDGEDVDDSWSEDDFAKDAPTSESSGEGNSGTDGDF